ncbi:hypothetical protein MBANPS3_009440 [Mucor bainieri]
MQTQFTCPSCGQTFAQSTEIVVLDDDTSILKVMKGKHKQCHDCRDELFRAREELQQMENYVSKLEAELDVMEEDIKDLESAKEALENQASLQVRYLNQQQRQIEALNSQVKELNDKLKASVMYRIITDQQVHIRDLEKEIGSLKLE